MKKLILIFALALVSVGAEAQTLVSLDSNPQNVIVNDSTQWYEYRMTTGFIGKTQTLKLTFPSDLAGVVRLNVLSSSFTKSPTYRAGDLEFLTIWDRLYIKCSDTCRFKISW